jgi:hypothetical protein
MAGPGRPLRVNDLLVAGVMASIEGRRQQLYGTACRQPGGST